MIASLTRNAAGGPNIRSKPAGAQTRLRRGTLVNYDANNWTANVMLDGAAGSATVPIGSWIAIGALDNLLDTGNGKVAVLLFNDNNPNDGLLIGAYGDTPGWDYFTRTELPGSLTIPGATAHQMIVHNEYSITGTLTVESNSELIVL